jgi:hypothetical protein
MLVRAKVRELEVDADVLAAQQRDDLLQGVPVLAGHAHSVALDAGLRFEFGILNQRNDLFGWLRRDALLELDLLPNRRIRCRLNLLVFQVLERDAALHELLPKDFN